MGLYKYVVCVHNALVWNLSQILTVLVVGRKIVYFFLCVYVLCVRNTVFGAFGEIDHAVAGKKLVVLLVYVLCMYVVCVCKTLFGAPWVILNAHLRAKMCVCFLSFCVWYVCVHAWRYGFVYTYTKIHAYLYLLHTYLVEVYTPSCLHMYVHMYVHIYTHVYTYMYVHMYVYIYTHVYTYTHVCMCIEICMYICLHV